MRTQTRTQTALRVLSPWADDVAAADPDAATDADARAAPEPAIAAEAPRVEMAGAQTDRRAHV